MKKTLCAALCIAISATAAAAIEMATGFSDSGDPNDPASWLPGVEQAVKSARAALKSDKADVVIVWDNLPLTDADAETKILPLISEAFPGALVCGKRDRWRPQYSPYAEAGAAIAHGISLMALSGVKASVVSVASGDSDAAAKEGFLAKMNELGEALKPLPDDARLVIAMGAFHGKGELVAQGLKTALGDSMPIIGGSAGGVGSIITEGEIAPQAMQALVLSGDFSVSVAGAKRMGDWQAEFTQEIKVASELAACEKALEQAKAGGHKPKGIIWFNCQGRCEQPGAAYKDASAEAKARLRNMHHSAIKDAAGDLSFWGHFSGAEVGPIEGTPGTQGGGYMAVFAVLSDPPKEAK